VVCVQGSQAPGSSRQLWLPALSHLERERESRELKPQGDLRFRRRRSCQFRRPAVGVEVDWKAGGTKLAGTTGQTRTREVWPSAKLKAKHLDQSRNHGWGWEVGKGVWVCGKGGKYQAAAPGGPRGHSELPMPPRSQIQPQMSNW